VKDYYNVNPRFSQRSIKRLEEFEALIARTHDAGIKVIIDIVQSYARKYEGKIIL
jgi:glycosidase